jgi:hypothetical protein
VEARGSAARWQTLAAVAAVSLLGASGCTGSSPSSASTPERPSTPATLQIVAPAPNELTTRRVVARLRLAHAHLVPATQVGGALRPDAGHVHLTLDGQLVAMLTQLDARLPRLDPGTHTLVAEFVASDHVPFANRVVAAVTFRVR